jgi:hypothetical protein
MAGNVTVSGFLSGVPFGQVNVGPFSLAMNAGNNLQMTNITLASGANTITVPTWAVGMLIIPTVTNVTGLTLKGVTGDTGIPLSPSNPTGPITFTAGAFATFVLTAASLFTTNTQIVFF